MKKGRVMPLRQLLARVPNLLVRLKPCLMMSPLAVSTYLESPEFQFDIVIFDEASQVLPWDAIGAVYRGRQLVVAGDQNPAHQIARIANAFREALLLPVTSPTAVPEVSQPSPEVEPILRIRDFRDAKPTPRFANIEDVPDGEIARVLLRLAIKFGVTPRADLIKSAAHELGFERTGKRISARIESVIQDLVQQGRLRDAGDERLGVSI